MSFAGICCQQSQNVWRQLFNVILSFSVQAQVVPAPDAGLLQDPKGVKTRSSGGMEQVQYVANIDKVSKDIRRCSNWN